MNTKLLSLVCCSALFIAKLAIAQDQALTLVQVDKVQSESIAQQVWVPGTVVSEMDSQLSSEVEGRIVWMAPVGTKVKQGEVLVKLDDKRLRFTLAQDKSNVARWQSSVALLQKRRERLIAMVKQNSASKDELDELVSQLEIAQQELNQAQLAYDITAYQIRQSQLSAPFDVLVVEQLQSTGEFTAMGAPLLRVVNPSKVEASVRAPLSVIPYIAAGMKVSVSDQRQVHEVPIKTIVPVGNGSSRTMEVRIALQPEDFAIGSAIRVALPHSHYREGLTIPRDALVLRQAGVFVYQVNKQMEAEKVPVTTGIGLGDRIEVFGELEQEDMVVTRGAEFLKPGQKVRLNNQAQDEVAKL